MAYLPLADTFSQKSLKTLHMYDFKKLKAAEVFLLALSAGNLEKNFCVSLDLNIFAETSEAGTISSVWFRTLPIILHL